jgi:hypothetical protein
LSGESTDVLNRRDLALRGLGEGPDRAFLENAIKTAGENPFLQPRTGDFAKDMQLLASRLNHAREVGAPKMLEAQIREMARQIAVQEDVLRTAPTEKRSGIDNPDRIRDLKLKMSPEAAALLDEAVQEARKLRDPKARLEDPSIADPYTAEWVRNTFKDQEKFQEWKDYLDAYKQANKSVDVKNASVLRRVFFEWAEGKYIGSQGLPRSLFSDVDYPDPRFTAHFADPPAPREDLKLAGKLVSVPVETAAGKTIFELDVEETLKLRQQKIADRDAIPLPGQELTPAARKQLDREINDLSESLGVAAGLLFARNHFPTAKLYVLEGPGVFDIIVDLGNKGVLIECKGGRSPLGNRESEDLHLRVEQGTKEYAQSVADEMATAPRFGDDIHDLGTRLRTQLDTESDFPDYYYVRQPLPDDGTLPPPLVGKFGKKP